MLRHLSKSANSLSRSHVLSSSSSSQRLFSSSSTTTIDPSPTLSASKHRAMHLTSLSLAGLIPISLMGPSAIAMPADVGLSLLIPLHMMVGLKGIVGDYVPSCLQTPSLALLYLLSGTTAVGLLGLSTTSPDGMVGTALKLWKKPSPSSSPSSQ